MLSSLRITRTKWREEKLSGKLKPQPRSYCASALYQSTLFIHGGTNPEETLNDFWKLTLDDQFVWEEVQQSGNSPGRLSRHSLVQVDGKLYLAGGINRAGTSQKGFFEYHCARSTWRRLTELPEAIDSHVCSEYDGRIFVLTGYCGQLGSFNDQVWIFSLRVGTWERVKSPVEPRSGACSSLVEDELYIFGGKGLERHQGLCWVNLNTFQLTQQLHNTMPEPKRRSGGIMVEWERKLFVFGGIIQVTQEVDQLLCFDIDSSKWEAVADGLALDYCNYTGSIRLIDENLTVSSPAKTKKHIPPKKSADLSIYFRTNTKDTPVYTLCSPPAPVLGSQVKSLRHSAWRRRKGRFLREFDVANEQLIHDDHLTNQIKKAVKKIGLQVEARKRESNECKFMGPLKSHPNIGKMPCVRDGLVGFVYEARLYVLFGDRHLMSFNDLFSFDLTHA